jgi:hypothetical protein
LNSKNYIPIFVLLFMTFAVGWYLGTSPATVRLQLFEKRNPAGINDRYDFSEFSGDVLVEKSKGRLFEEVKISVHNPIVEVEIGHFVVRGTDDQPEFACGYYTQVALTFYADGMASNGQVPEMTVVDNCVVGSNVNRIMPLRIPFQMILAERVGDADFSFNDFSNVSMRNIGEEWPRTWFLHSIRLSNPDYSDRVIESDHISSGKGPIYQFSF